MAQEVPLNCQRGGRLYARDINDLSRVTSRTSRPKSRAKSIYKDFEYDHKINNRPLDVVEVIEALADPNTEEDIPGVFLCGRRFYDTEEMENGLDNSGEWLTDVRADPESDSYNEDAQYVLDARGLSSYPAIGDQLSAWWDVESQAYIPTGTPAASATWYQLIDDNDTDIYSVKANPGVLNTDSGFLYDPHALPPAGWTDAHPGETWDADNPDWTVILVDLTGQIPCWAGDWVRCETLADIPEELSTLGYDVKSLTYRASAQLDVWGWLTEDLPPQVTYGDDAHASARLIINGATSDKIVWEGGLLIPGQSLRCGTTIIARYYPNLRHWYCVGAPCGTA